VGHPDFSVQGRRVVVVGAARSGIAAAELLARRGAHVMLTEIRPTIADADRLRAAGIEVELGGHRQATLEMADLVVVSPGVPVDGQLFDALRHRGVEIIGELELAWRWIRGRVIAITGTKGKSTTTTLVGRMLAAGGHHALIGGNIGVPLSAQVDTSTPDTIHVVEVSSFQLETTTTFRPWIAVWLNLADDHLDRHRSLDAYVSAKARVFANQTSGDWAVLNADDPVVTAHGALAKSARVDFSLSDHAPTGFVVHGDWIARRTTTGIDRLIPLTAVELTGRHMLNNVLAATAVAAIAEVSSQAMVGALRGFRGLPHVMEPVAEIRGVRFVNDSKATNVEAAQRSIESFPRGVVAIVGGHFKGGDLRQLREPLSVGAVAVVAIGTAAPMVHDALQGVVPVLDAGSMREAVERGYEAAAPGGVVLLAPACASFDWFRDYAERGETFKAEVVRLKRAVEGEGAEGT
jgi:UDP-N-acetylmuramoylalanine--D-glutamate ligase